MKVRNIFSHEFRNEYSSQRVEHLLLCADGDEISMLCRGWQRYNIISATGGKINIHYHYFPRAVKLVFFAVSGEISMLNCRLCIYYSSPPVYLKFPDEVESRCRLDLMSVDEQRQRVQYDLYHGRPLRCNAGVC